MDEQITIVCSRATVTLARQALHMLLEHEETVQIGQGFARVEGMVTLALAELVVSDISAK